VPNFSKVFLSDLDEEKSDAIQINNNTVTLKVAPYKIITIKLSHPAPKLLGAGLLYNKT
jgi:hypothetical protein